MASTRKSPKSSSLLAQVSAALKRHVRRGERLTAGYSGGVDSAVLLDLLRRLAPRLGFKLSALHVNHGLSPHAESWARFCARTCRAHAVPFAVERVTLSRGGSVEAAARNARLRAFAAQRADFVVLAHNLDDQAETVLLQLLRGAGVKGLSAMPELRIVDRGLRIEESKSRIEENGKSKAKRNVDPRSSILNPAVLRPLLDVPRAEIERYARRRKLAWIDDESNADTRFDRNFIRHEVLPLIAQRYPAYRRTLARASRNLAEASQLLDELAAADASLSATGIPISALKALSGVRAKNALRYFLAREGAVLPNAARLDECVRQILSATRGTRMALDLGSHDVLRCGDELRVIPKRGASIRAYTCAWEGQDRLELDELGGTLEMKKRRGAGISLDRLLQAPVTVRLRQGGERFRPDARRPRRSLKNLLQEARMPPWIRERLPLLFCGSTLVYVPGVGIDAGYAAARGEDGVEPSWEFA